MPELRVVAVSDDGTRLVLKAPTQRSTRFRSTNACALPCAATVPASARSRSRWRAISAP
ncbi:hypothetical protein SALBM311S_04545 [Streptomyces alboniger]